MLSKNTIILKSRYFKKNSYFNWQNMQHFIKTNEVFESYMQFPKVKFYHIVKMYFIFLVLKFRKHNITR